MTAKKSPYLNPVEELIDDALGEGDAQEWRTYRLTLTPARAKVFLENMCDEQRTEYERTVGKYVEEMAKKKWKFTGQGIIVSTLGKIMNGQHTCRACVVSGVPIEVLVIMDVDPDAFYAMDGGRKRSPADFLKEEKNAAAIGAALQLIYTECSIEKGDPTCNNHDMPAGDAPALLEKHPNLRNIAAPSRCLVPPSLYFYARYRTERARRWKERSESFWEAILDGIARNERDPRWLLRKQLENNANSGDKKMTKSHMLAIIIKAWNAWARGEEVKGRLTYVPFKKDPSTGEVTRKEQYPEWLGGKLQA
jgi:hypothetical protein